MLIVLLAACASGPKEYLEPTGGEAEACLQYCQVERSDCREAAREQHLECEARYRYHYREWRYCVSQRGERACVSRKPFACPAPRYRSCSVNYDRCFIGCGGQID